MAVVPRPSTDKADLLAVERRETEGEIDRLRREERDLAEKVRRAREQVRYYSTILQRLKVELTGRPDPNQVVRRLR